MNVIVEMMTMTMIDEEDFRETADVLLLKYRFGYFSVVKKSSVFVDTGDYSSVSLEKRWGAAIQEREEKHGDVAGFFHVHPPGHPTISEIDIATAMAFSLSYGKLITMVVGTPGNKPLAWLVNDDGAVAEADVFPIPFMKEHFLIFKR